MTPPESTRRGTGSIERRKERAERHAAESDPGAVLAAAVRLLEARPRTVSDLRTRLLRASWPPGFVDGAIERLTELGFLDDEAYARAWLESRDRGRPRGEYVLKHELRRKGVAQAVVEAALEERREDAALSGDVDASADELAAERLLAKRARSMDRLSDERARRQWAYALLARNGFDPDVAARVAGRAGQPSDAVSPGATSDD